MSITKQVSRLEKTVNDLSVCFCGCDISDHDTDVDGEECGVEEHVCIRVFPSVLIEVAHLRGQRDALLAQVRAQNALQARSVGLEAQVTT